MIRFSFLSMITGVILNFNPVLATPVKEIPATEAQNSLDLEVPKGYGLIISFQKTGEKIIQAWLGDPSQIAFSTNNRICSESDNSSCQSGANVIFLRQIKPLDFPNLTRSSDGGTQLVVFTQGQGQRGQKQYTFRLLPGHETPEYTSVVLSPSQNPATDITNQFPTSIDFINELVK